MPQATKGLHAGNSPGILLVQENTTPIAHIGMPIDRYEQYAAEKDNQVHHKNG